MDTFSLITIQQNRCYCCNTVVWHGTNYNNIICFYTEYDSMFWCRLVFVVLSFVPVQNVVLSLNPTPNVILSLNPGPNVVLSLGPAPNVNLCLGTVLQ